MQSHTKDQDFESLDSRYTPDFGNCYERTCEKAGELVEKKLVDLLIERRERRGFTSYIAYLCLFKGK